MAAKIIHTLELHIRSQAKHHNRRDYELLLTTPGIGKMLSLVILYETHDIKRFPSPQDYASYSRVIKPSGHRPANPAPGAEPAKSATHISKVKSCL